MPTIELKDSTHVRWEIPGDVMRKITKHKKILALMHPDREITQEEAAIHMLRSRKLPKAILLEQ